MGWGPQPCVSCEWVPGHEGPHPHASLLAAFPAPRGSSSEILWLIPVSCSLSNWRVGWWRWGRAPSGAPSPRFQDAGLESPQGLLRGSQSRPVSLALPTHPQPSSFQVHGGQGCGAVHGSARCSPLPGELGTKELWPAFRSFENNLSCTQSPGPRTRVYLSPIYKRKTDPSSALRKDIFGIWLPLK